MNPHQLHSNNELRDYLVWLSNELKSKGQSELADDVYLASRFAVGSASEFLHEAGKALRKVKASSALMLTGSQLTDIAKVIEQIETAFKKVGGA
ncbi:hypothetical protein GC207_13515 [bacterium]|nr:hypothetical protein [bacterium]